MKYVLNGYNISSESVLPSAWRGYPAIDRQNAYLFIYKKYGRGLLRKFPIISIWKLRFIYTVFDGLKLVSPLNCLDYNKMKHLKILKENLNFEEYGGKNTMPVN